MKKTSKRTKRVTKKTLAVLLILSICFSTINIEAIAEEEQIVTQTEPGEVDSDSQKDEDKSDAQPSEGENDSQPSESESDSQPSVDESGSQPSESESDSQPSEDESGSGNDAAAEDADIWDGVTTESVYEGENFKVTFALSGYWNGGYNANVKVENTGNTVIENWTMEVDYAGAISNIWNAVIDSSENGKYIIKNAGWNQNIAVGGNAEFGISGQENFPGFPKKYTLLGSISDVADEDYSIAYHLDSDWGDGFTATISITNNTDSAIEDWYLEFDFNRNITNIWNGVTESHEGKHYIIKNAGYNANINAGQTISFGFSGDKGTSTDEPMNYELSSHALSGKKNSRYVDTDGDGLTDYEELNITLTDPEIADTDGNGIIDSEEDLDEDGINNRNEIDLGTDPLNSDTDRDNLSDYKELYQYHTDPLLEDTDGDDLTDYDDIKLGFSPLLKDTDGNGIIDSEERVYQTVTEQLKNPQKEGVTAVSVSLSIKGNAEKHVGIVDMYEFDKLSSGVVGLVGVPVEIGCDTDFQQADITFHYDVNALGDTKEEDLSIMWYDEANDWYQILDGDSVIDTTNHTVTYTTTHFSTYMLVDSIVWYGAWRENIDYRNSSSADTEKNYFDIAFVVDVSGSMGGSRIRMAKTAMGNFINTMQTNDEAALITFSHITSLKQGFTSDFEAIRKAVSMLSASGGTDVNSGLITALSAFDKHECNKQKIMVLICDGDVNYVQKTINRCIAGGIQIYAINVANTSTHATLQKMTDQTGGEYYYASNVDQLEMAFANVIGDTTEQIDPTDTDGDGLYDIFETAGMKLENGQVIYSDPAKPDTDGDGLTDYQETGIVYNVDNRYIGAGQITKIKYFVMRSFPDQVDSDGDGLTDDVDDKPLMPEYVAVAKLNSKPGDDYLDIVDDNGTHYPGGNQGWWKDWSRVEPEDLILVGNEMLGADKYYRLWQMGCGTIAMSDAELYMTVQNSGYSSSDSSGFGASYRNYGFCTKADYMQYIDNLYDGKYEIKGDILNRNIGLYPWQMTDGFSKFLIANGNPHTNVKWALYTTGAYLDDKRMIVNDIERMLKEDIPVVFSYHSFNKYDRIRLYSSLENAKNDIESDQDQTPLSHYMTIIGLHKYAGGHPLQDKYILEVVSWGKVYYIDYDMYAKKLSIFSNILSVY
ncbi:MAG: cellulose binding domain-containing protein [Lachnospiraceae bacterium]|nr:cellulose binding domain-containing protein [Lachnospiraceae bacterium]